MKKTFIILFYFSPLFVYSQTQKKIINFLDFETNNPIPNVHVYDSISKTGVVSNAEGKIKILSSLKINDLLISHIGYKKSNFIKKKDIIYLIPKVSKLNEIIIVDDFKLIKKIRYVLKKYKDLYSTSPNSFFFNYKETKRINDTLYKLFQAQLEWNNSIKLSRKSLKKENKFKLIGVEFKKITLPKWDHISLPDKLIVAYLHANMILEEVSYCKNISIKQINSIENNKITEVIFTADLIKPYLLFFLQKPKESELKKSKIYFDNKTGAIVKMLLNKKMISSNFNYIIEATFNKHQPNQKLTLSNLHITTTFYNSNKANIVTVTNDFSVIKTQKASKILEKELTSFSRINKFKLKTDNYPPQDKIILTKEEMEFMKEK